jgi:hypothetical protein
MRYYFRVEEDIRQTEVARAVSFHSISIVLDDALSHLLRGMNSTPSASAINGVESSENFSLIC